MLDLWEWAPTSHRVHCSACIFISLDCVSYNFFLQKQMHFVAVEWLKGGKSMFWCFDSLLLANISSFFLDELQAAWLFFIHAFKKSWAKKNILKKKKSRTEGQRRCLSHLFGFLRFAKFTGTQALYSPTMKIAHGPSLHTSAYGDIETIFCH